jgi:uncharacterized protein
MPTKRSARILSIDGGGIRGIIPAMVLAEIERRSGRHISELFDLIAGSSTGGMLAMGFTVPDDNGKPTYGAEDAVELYETNGALIFSRNMWHLMHSVGSLLTTKYPTDGLERLLDETFGEARMSDVLTDVLITGYEIQRRQPWFFRSRNAKENAAQNFLVRDVVRATTAAPTYFEPARIATGDADHYLALIDGSVSASHPALLAYVEARDLYPDVDEFIVVSLGTGDDMKPLSYEEARYWGVAGWSQQLLGVAFQAMNQTLDYQLQKLLATDQNGRSRYFRLQTGLDGVSLAMDDVSPQNIAGLKRLGQELIEKNDAMIDQMVTRLTEPLIQPHVEPVVQPQPRSYSLIETVMRWYQQFWATRTHKAAPVEVRTNMR